MHVLCLCNVRVYVMHILHIYMYMRICMYLCMYLYGVGALGTDMIGMGFERMCTATSRG